jgi:hypothetical protein
MPVIYIPLFPAQVKKKLATMFSGATCPVCRKIFLKFKRYYFYRGEPAKLHHAVSAPELGIIDARA